MFIHTLICCRKKREIIDECLNQETFIHLHNKPCQVNLSHNHKPMIPFSISKSSQTPTAQSLASVETHTPHLHRIPTFQSPFSPKTSPSTLHTTPPQEYSYPAKHSIPPPPPPPINSLLSFTFTAAVSSSSVQPQIFSTIFARTSQTTLTPLSYQSTTVSLLNTVYPRRTMMPWKRCTGSKPNQTFG